MVGLLSVSRTVRVLSIVVGAMALLFYAVPRAMAVEDSTLSPPTELEAVSATSASDAWAVGVGDAGAEAIIRHWDGNQWSPMTAPGTIGSLYGVDALAPSDVWAVGRYSAPQTHTVQTYILHWDGSAWSRVPSPNPSSFLNVLYGVSAAGADDAWAVGYSLTPSHQFHSLLLRWNGIQWSNVPVPGMELDAVTALSSSNAWAVGNGVLLHWNGSRWSKKSVKTRSFLRSVKVTKLLGVSAVSASNIWAVGQRCAHYGACVKRTAVIHWNGRRWRPVTSPAPASGVNFLTSVQALAANDVWAVGTYCAGSCLHERSLIIHWDGRRWSTVTSPDPGASVNILAGVGAKSPSQVWAVGAAGGNSAEDNLTLEWSGTQWSTS